MNSWGMGRTLTPVPINMLMMLHRLEIIGNFMVPPMHTRKCSHRCAPVSSTKDSLRPRCSQRLILPQAMKYAAKAQSLECVVLTTTDRG